MPLRAAGFRSILPFASRSQVGQRVEVDRAWPAAVRARLVWLVELLRPSEQAVRCVQGTLRAMERPVLHLQACDGGEERVPGESGKRSLETLD